VQHQRISLRCLRGNHEGRVWESDQLLHVGRLPTYEIALTDASVSRQHAEVAFTNLGWVVRDLGSTNGTFLNGVRIGRAEQALRKGDIIQFGDITMIVDVTEPGKPEEPGRTDGSKQVAGSVQLTFESLSQTVVSALAPRPAGKDPLLALIQTGRDFYRFSTTEDYVRAILWEAAETLDARAGAILLHEEATGRLACRAVFALNGKSTADAWSDDGLAQRALDQETSLLCHASAPGHGPPGGSGLRSLIYAVLRSPRGRLGVLCLAREADQAPFTDAELKLADALALCVSAGIDSLAHLLDKQRELFLQTLTALTQVVELRGGAVYGQAQRVTDYALLLAEELGLSEQDRHDLRIGVPLRDLGKIAVNDALLQKAGPLTPAEKEQIRSHVLKGTALLESIPALAPLMPLVRSHHEWWDGTGYPDGLRGEQIPLLARVVGLAEVLDVLTTDRPYRRRLALADAFAEIERQAGVQFDPAAVQALLRLRPRIEALLRERKLTTSTISRDALREVVGALGLQKPPRAQRAASQAAMPDSRA
jgi:HD-GYP domain-containing protein (c-di-GMP phosphodiesterase class II)